MMQGKLSAITALSVLTVLAILSSIVFWLEGSQSKEALRQANERLDGAAAVVSNVQLTMKIFSEISARRADEKERDRQAGEKARAALRSELQTDRCASEPLPAAAERRLLEHADGIRARSVRAPPGRTASAYLGAIPVNPG